MYMTPAQLIEALRAVDFRHLDWELRRLEAIARWAQKQAVPFETGDKVRIKEGFSIPQFFPDGHPHGWWHFRDVLIPGETGTAGKISFHHSDPSAERWLADFTPDFTPDPGLFTFDVKWLEKV